MIQTDCIFPLPLYAGNGKAFWQSRKWWAGKVYPLYYPLGYLPPFQVSQESEEAMVIDVYREDGTIVGSTDALSIDGGYNDNTLLNYGNLPQALTFASGESWTPGRYYMRLYTEDEVDEYISEIWTAVSDINPYLRIEWWDDQNLQTEQGEIIYDGTFKNRIHIAADLAKPEYTFDEEGQERDGYFYPEKMVSTKKYHFSFLAPEYLLDALRFVRMSDHIRITAKWPVPSGPTPTITYNCDSFLFSPEWLEEGDLATVSVEFTSGTITKKIAR